MGNLKRSKWSKLKHRKTDGQEPNRPGKVFLRNSRNWKTSEADARQMTHDQLNENLKASEGTIQPPDTVYRLLVLYLVATSGKSHD